MTAQAAAPGIAAPAPHVVVVGAGIVGVAAAVWLMRDGCRVTLIDRAGPAEGTSFGNGGVLASCAVVPVTGPGLVGRLPGMLLDRDGPLLLRWSYLPRLAPFLAAYLRMCGETQTRRVATALAALIGDSLEEHRALAAETAAAGRLVASDYLYAYRDRNAFAADGFAWQLRRELGFRWDELGADELRRAEPLLAEELRFGALLPQHGYVTDPGLYVKDLAAHIAAGGGRVIRADVTDVVVAEGRAAGVMAGGAAIDADAVVIAAGVWSAPLARRLGLTVPMESERGYHLDLVEPSAMPRRPMMIAAGKFVATPMEGRIRLAGFVEFGGLEAPPSPKAFARMERLARRAMPHLTWRQTRTWMGHRPAPADSLPLIGEAPAVPGAFLAFGHHHVGLTGGAKTGRLIADLVAGRRPNIDLAPFRPDRFDRRKGRSGGTTS